MRWTTTMAIGSLGLALACNSAEPAAPAAAVAPIAPAPAATEFRPQRVSGTVAERIDAASYTYLRLVNPTGDVWVAVSQAAVPVGTEVTLTDAILMEGFESKTLNRRFERIYFGTLGGGSGALPPGHPPVGQGATPAAVEPAIAKAEGDAARTVAEVWAQRGALVGTKVVVRGRIVKLTTGVLDRNWIHLRDGSGAAASGDHDLTVTSTDGAAAIGDVVTIEGVVRTDKDFGAGYAYPVIVEDAAIRR